MLSNDARSGSHPTRGEASRSRRGVSGALRGLILLGVLAIWLAVGAFGGMAQGSLSEVQENDQAAFLPESAESTRAAELAAEFSDSETLPALVVATDRAGGELTGDQLAAAEQLAEQIPAAELADGRTVEEVLTGQVQPIPSEDGLAVLLIVPIDADLAGEQVGDTGDEVGASVVGDLRDLAAEEFDAAGMDVWVTGPAGFVTDLSGAFAGIDGVLLVVALVVVLIILVLVYRSPVLPFTVLISAVFALCAAALVITPLAENDVLVLSGQSQGILSILVIGAATDYCLLIVARYREELTRTLSPYTAMGRAWRASLPPIAASAGTVIVGLLCLLLSDLSSNASLGPVGAVGIAAAVVSALTLLPALLLIAGGKSRGLFWPRKPAAPAAPEGELAEAGASDGATERSGIWWKVAELVGRYPRRVWAAAAVVLVALAAFVPTFQAEGTSEGDVFLNPSEAVDGQEVLAEHFEAGQVEPILIVAPQQVAEETAQAVSEVEGVRQASVREEDGEPIVVDGRVVIEAVSEVASESQEATAIAAQVRATAHDVEADVVVGGAPAERLDTQETASADLWTIVPVVLLVIFVMLAVLLRSLVAPLLILIVNVLSFAATLGLSAIIFNHIFGFPGADPTVPLFGFIFLVALSIDYSIFLMTRVREEALAEGTERGVLTGLAKTGGVITSAGVVLAATFGALGVIPLLFLAQLAFIVSVGVLIDTFIVRSLLVSGLVYELGHRVWWPWASRFPRETGPTTPAA